MLSTCAMHWLGKEMDLEVLQETDILVCEDEATSLEFIEDLRAPAI